MISADGVLYFLDHTFGVRTVIVAVSCGEYGFLSLCRQSVEHFLQVAASVLEDALVHHAFQVVLGLCRQIPLAVKRALVLCRGYVTFLLHPFQHVHPVAVHKFRKRHFLIG